jgi:Protein of unknown function (DUF2398)
MIEEDVEPELVAAARSMEQNPFMDARIDKEMFRLIRRHAPELRTRFAQNLGYRLVVETGFARLMKPPMPDGSPARPGLRNTSGKAVSPRVYQYICLIGASLQAPGMGEQMLISQLSAQLRADAADAGVVLGDGYTERREFVAAMHAMIGWGFMSETEGTVSDWADSRQEALLTVDRNRLPFLLSNLMSGDGGRPESPIRSLSRRVAESPVVLRADLTEEERLVLRTDRPKLDATLDMFGMHVEVRREGLLAWGEGDDLTDEPFPGEGAVRQAALLFIAETLTGRQPGEDGWVTISVRAAQEVVDKLLASNARSWKRDFDPNVDGAGERAMRSIIEFLSGFGLAVDEEAFVRIHPAGARYRVEVTRAARTVPPPLESEPFEMFDLLGEE